VSSKAPALPTTIEECHAMILRLLPLVVKVEELQARVEELERRLNQTSQNSSRPPSSDPPHAAKRPPKKPPSGRKPGGQPGHDGNHREWLPPEKVDEVVDHWPKTCEGCQRPLAAGLRVEVDEAIRHQVTEWPPAKAHVTEHRLHTQQCECGWATTAPLPDGVPTGAFGPRLQGITSLLTGCYRLSKRTAQEILSDLFGVSMALGSVTSCEQTISQAVAPAVDEARRYVEGQGVGHADETGWRERRRRAWLWVLATALVTVFLIHRRRNRDAAKALLGSFAGTLVSDRWVAYDDHDEQRRQLCWSHLARDFVALSEYRGKVGRIGKQLVDETLQMFQWWHRVRDGTLARTTFRRKMKPLLQRVERLLQRGVTSGVPKAAGLCWEIARHGDALWRFVRVEGVPPTNNDAERALRFAVLWRKGSFGTHSEAGSRFAERILTVRTTLRQQGRNVADYVTHSADASLHGLPPPSLLPQAA
jgi:transposase